MLLTSGLVPGHQISYRDLAQAIQALYATGQFDDVRIEQDSAAAAAAPAPVLVIRVKERPTRVKWAIRGVGRLSEHTVRDRVQLVEGRPFDPAAVERARGRIDSLYRSSGYYLARVRTLRVFEGDSSRVRLVSPKGSGGGATANTTTKSCGRMSRSVCPPSTAAGGSPTSK